MKRIFPVLILIGMLFVATASAQESSTTVNDKAAAQKLLGKHRLSLQWISWDYFGAATVTNKKCSSGVKGCYRINGEQKGRGNSDYLKINGAISSIDSKQFRFNGTIETRISHINGGSPCVRSGEFTFKITGKRKYWRLAEMDNPCDPVTDYVDIYFR
ncbi:MAG: hypothetical protein IPL32_02495 [Chloracidobacterium sp.]|nr:hypothetical protein [Chloracidobacterium sp.]